MQFEVATPAELPQWMRQSRRQIDWGFVLAGLIGLAMAWSILLRPGIPATSDLFNSAFMTSDLAAALREGQVLPRWSPHALSGYGAPVPSQVPQGAAYLAAVVEQLFTGDTSTAVMAVSLATLVLAAMTTYGWIRALLSPAAAMLGSAVYVLSPFVGQTVSHSLGDLALIVSLAVLPGTLWAGTRVVQAPSRTSVVLFTIGLTIQASVLPALSLTAAVTILAFGLIVNRPGALRAVVCTVSAALLFAPFWFPALINASAISWIANPAPDDRVFHLADLLAPVAMRDPALLNPLPVFGPGLAALGVAGLGVLTVVRKRSRRGSIACAALLLAACVVGTGLVSAPWWFIVINAAAAVLAGAAAEWRYRLPISLRRAFVPALLVGLGVVSAPAWYVPATPTVSDFSPAAQVAYEQRGLGIPVVPPGQALPGTLAIPVRTDPNLIESYRQPLLVRIRPGTPARVTPIYTQSHSSAWQISVMSPQSIVVSQAYYPGWQAYLEGVALPTERDPETGLVRIAVPQTASATLVLAQAITPVQGLAWVLAGLGIAILGLAIRFTPTLSQRELPRYDTTEARLTGLVVLAVIAAALLTATPDAPIALHAEPLSSLQGKSLLRSEAGPITLVAYQIDGSIAQPGGEMALELYWTATTNPGQNVTIGVELVDLDQRSWAVLSAAEAPGMIATRRWPADVLVRDLRYLSIPSDLPSGIYQLALSAYVCDTVCTAGQRTPFRDSRGSERRALLLPQVIAIRGE